MTTFGSLAIEVNVLTRLDWVTRMNVPSVSMLYYNRPSCQCEEIV
jgi:hypothetical protein